jgi:hypothetical protein
MLGNYKYVPCKLMVSKVVTKGGVPHAFFIDGSYDEVST